MHKRQNRYQRPPRPLPDPSTIPFPGNLVRGCTACGLHKRCRAPVPGYGNLEAEVFLAGQSPGVNEGLEGRPFVGLSGQYVDSLLYQCGISRESVFIDNVVHCLTPGNRVPNSGEISACSHWLDKSVEVVNPRIVVAMGVIAIRHFLGPNAGTVEHLHGKPVEVDGRIILPAYHPAAALRDTARLRQCQEDFNVLRGLVKGRHWSYYHAVGEYPTPDYKVADTPRLLSQMRDEIMDSGEFAVDTELSRGELWSVQISAILGTGWFIPIKDQKKYNLLPYGESLCVVHNYLFDVHYLDIREDNFVDSMVMAYLVGAPQGLKELAWRLCGVAMKTYRETVRAGQDVLSLEYLLNAGKQEWPDPPPIVETRWDNKLGGIAAKSRKPWHISRKVNKALSDYAFSPETIDLWDRWTNIPEEERSVVESVLGPMPESSLADIPRDEAVSYSIKDADTTLRVYHKLRDMIQELELDMVLQIDTDILPMVHCMMQTGMPVDLDHLRTISVDFDERMRYKAAELAALAGHTFNPNSSPQVAQVVYGELGFVPESFTPTGLISTDDRGLKKTGHPIAKGVIQYRGIQKLKSTYADSLIDKAVLDSAGVPRVHTTIKTTRTETGRASSADPNLQNIPTRNKDGKLIKTAFCAPDGWLLAELDYGQIEMCVQAHAAKCGSLIDLFRRGDDPHTVTASKIFGVSYEDAKQSRYRYPTKRANFGLIYGIGAPGLSEQIHEYISDLEMAGEPVDIEPWDVRKCEDFITEWYRLYPEVRDYQMEMASMARRYGYVRDMFGRIRYVPEVACPIRHIQEAGLRQGANMGIQSGAAEIIKKAMGTLWQQWPSRQFREFLKWLMTVHDSLIVEILDDTDALHSELLWVKRTMEDAVSLLVPVRVDVEVGMRWGALKEFSFEEDK